MLKEQDSAAVNFCYEQWLTQQGEVWAGIAEKMKKLVWAVRKQSF